MKELQPLSEPVFYALLALLNGPLHGYGIMMRVEEWTGGRVRLRTATLYTALSRLKAAGVLEESDEDPGGDGRRGRLYRLTAEGRQLVLAETHRLENLVTLARGVQADGGGVA